MLYRVHIVHRVLTVYKRRMVLCVIEKLVGKADMIKHDCILYISTQEARVHRWQERLRRLLLLDQEVWVVTVCGG